MKLDQIENLIQTTIEEEILFKELNKDLIKELGENDLLTELLKARIKSLIEKNTYQSIEENAKNWFGSSVEKTYFERRDYLERVSFKLVRNKDKGVILEAYQRLNEKEEEWSEISNRWGVEPEKKFQGKYRQILVHKLNIELINALKRNEIGEISQPIRLGQYFGIVQLDEWIAVELNEEMRAKLEYDLYEEWMRKKLDNAYKYAMQID